MVVWCFMMYRCWRIVGLWVQLTWSAGSGEQRRCGGVDAGGFSLTFANHAGVWRLGLHSGMHRFVFGQV